jgi:hypothetical protein
VGGRGCHGTSLDSLAGTVPVAAATSGACVTAEQIGALVISGIEQLDGKNVIRYNPLFLAES